MVLRKKTTSRKTAKGTQGRKSGTSNSGRSALRGFIYKFIAVSLVALTGFLIYLDAQVTSKFEGKRWALPAQVFARPLELYEGKPLPLSDLVYELKKLGYREESDVSRPGRYRVSGNRVSLFTREFQFSNETAPAQKINLRFDYGKIRQLESESGRAISLMSLEPVRVGGIFTRQREERLLVSIRDVPSFVTDTLVAVEDRGFYDHHGISPRAIARAFWVNVKSGKVLQGGSTLTQQLVKNFYLSSDRTLWRKAQEAIMAVLLDMHYDKEEILEAYLNEVYLGQAGNRAIHGFGLGSQYYFGRPLEKLKLHEAALLVGMVKGPSYYNPRRHPQRALARRNLALDLLAEQDVVARDVIEWSKQQPLDVIDRPSYSESLYPAFMGLVQRQLRRDYKSEDLETEGLRIFTSLDPLVQRDAEQSLSKTVAQLQNNNAQNIKNLQGAIVVTSTDTAEVLAVVGGREAKFSGFNRALDAIRPVGSLLKPAVYLTALSEPDKYTLATMADDSEVIIPNRGSTDWQPKNYDHESHGMVPLHTALAHSYNQATARLGMEVGLKKILATIKKLGVERPLPQFPSVILGAVGLSPIEVAGMYQTIAAGGFDTPLRSIMEVTTANGETLSRYSLKVEQKFDPGAIYLLHYALQETMRVGTGKSAYAYLPQDLNIAGKTGTTDDLRDSWFAGFTGDRLAIVWLGNDDNSPTRLTGGRGALRVWINLMQRLLPEPFSDQVPKQVAYYWVEENTGLLSGENCEGARYLPFIEGSQPVDSNECAVTQKPTPRSWLETLFK